MAKTRDEGTARFENPLMPDERLRQMYTAMVQARMLEERMLARARRARKGKETAAIATIRGEEAARASTVLSLGAGDMLSDSVESPGMDLLLGGSKAQVRGAAKNDEAAASGVLRLPLMEDGEERIQMALGAGAALRAQAGGRVLLVYVRRDEVGTKHWKRTLHRAGSGQLPIVFLLLPEEKSADAGELARRSQNWGVPGFPVDGADAIGLYRVMQESLLRARAGGGAVLIECIAFRLHGDKESGREDPVERLGELMVSKGAASAEWLKATRLAAGRRVRTS